jgi:hypothetical protein
VNANGNQLDVWIIYQCEKCKHTYNLTIYERIKSSDLNKEEYQRFLSNDQGLATEYGKKKELFAKNKCEIDLEQISYQLALINDQPMNSEGKFIIRNPCEIKVRTDKILSEILHIARSSIKTLIEREHLSTLPKYISRETEVRYYSEELFQNIAIRSKE